MIKIAIVDDKAEDSQALLQHLKRFEQEENEAFQISIFNDGIDIISDYTASWDILFLDIQMKHLDGITTAQKIRELDDDVEIIFTTITAQYAVQGYTVNALGYIVKPVSYTTLAQTLRKALRKVEKKHDKYFFTINVENGVIRLESSSIYYLESQKHYVMVHAEEGTFRTAGPLKTYENELIKHGFAKCHNSYLVNLDAVRNVTQNEIILTNNEYLPISRTFKNNFMDSLTNYLG